MNSKPMLFECLDCKETYLADNLCDGYKCPKCNGHITERGFVNEIEKSIKDMQNKIKTAKKNGLIRNYYKYCNAPKPNLPPIPNNYIIGLDLSSEKDSTVHTINTNVNAKNVDKDKLIDEIIKMLNKDVKQR